MADLFEEDKVTIPAVKVVGLSQYSAKNIMEQGL
jgi:hypothetical protein